MQRLILLLLLTLFSFGQAWADDCVDCHKKTSSGVVADWEASKHSKATKDKATCATCWPTPSASSPGCTRTA